MPLVEHIDAFAGTHKAENSSMVITGILACDGRAEILHNVAVGASMLGVSVAMMLLALSAFLFVKRFRFLPLAQLGLVILHPYFWVSVDHGDCGGMLRSNSITWAILGIGLLLAQYLSRLIPAKSLRAPGFPVVLQQDPR